MGALAPPWPPTLIEPIEYGAFRRVPGPPKAENHQKSAFSCKGAENPHFSAFNLEWVEFRDFSLLGVQGPSERLNIPLVL